MIDPRPVGYLLGLLVVVLGATMLVPLAVDALRGNGHWPVFAQSALISMVGGALVAVACANAVPQRLIRQQVFLLVSGAWIALPAFGALPFVLGATEASVTDAVFEAMSGITTTGSTVFAGLEALPRGLLLWRSMLQWFGGIGIIIVAMVFLPELRIGGMQIFASEAFETMGKILPRAAEIASRISWIYVAFTGLCYFCYLLAGMSSFEAANHALTTLSTGGFSTSDASYGAYGAAIDYIAVVFMILASLPFVRYVQLLSGTAAPLWRDAQVHAYLLVIVSVSLALSVFLLATGGFDGAESLREVLFNVTSIVSGTGYASADYQLWGSFAMAVIFFLGLVGGCAGSTTCSVKIFRYQILFSAIRAQIRRIHSPHGLFHPRYEDRPVSRDVINSVMAFFVLFILSLGVLAVMLSFTGLDFVTSISGAATAIANIGPGLGDLIGPAGYFGGLNTPAKWMLIAAMLVGRLELLVVYVVFTRVFWRG